MLPLLCLSASFPPLSLFLSFGLPIATLPPVLAPRFSIFLLQLPSHLFRCSPAEFRASVKYSFPPSLRRTLVFFCRWPTLSPFVLLVFVCLLLFLTFHSVLLALSSFFFCLFSCLPCAVGFLFSLLLLFYPGARFLLSLPYLFRFCTSFSVPAYNRASRSPRGRSLFLPRDCAVRRSVSAASSPLSPLRTFVLLFLHPCLPTWPPSFSYFVVCFYVFSRCRPPVPSPSPPLLFRPLLFCPRLPLVLPSCRLCRCHPLMPLLCYLLCPPPYSFLFSVLPSGTSVTVLPLPVRRGLFLVALLAFFFFLAQYLSFDFALLLLCRRLPHSATCVWALVLHSPRDSLRLTTCLALLLSSLVSPVFVTRG